MAPQIISPFDPAASIRLQRMGLLTADGQINTSAVEAVSVMQAGLLYTQILDACGDWDSTRNVCSKQHASVRPRAVLISGAAIQTGEYTFRYDPHYFGFDPKRLWDGITICIEADGDNTYKPAVQELNIQIKR